MFVIQEMVAVLAVVVTVGFPVMVSTGEVALLTERRGSALRTWGVPSPTTVALK